MKPRQQVSRAALELIKSFEGYRQKSAQLSDGRWTIGYGHTLTAREGAEVSQSDAEALLLYDLIAVAHAVNEHVYTPLTQNQFDALACFAFNIGVENFRRSSVLRRINEGELLKAAYAMEMWRRADFEGERIIIDALVRRRSAEKTLFLTPQDGWSAAPSSVLPPKIDFEVEPFAPREKPTALNTPLDGPLAIAHREEGESLSAMDISLLSPAQPTAAEQAAAAVAARLEAIVPDADFKTAPAIAAQASEAPIDVAPEIKAAGEPAPQTPDEPAPPPAPTQAESWTAATLAAPEPFTLSPPDETLASVVAAPSEAEPQVEVAPTPDPTLFDAVPAMDAPAGGKHAKIIENHDAGFAGGLDEAAGFSGMPLVALGLVGLVIFSGGVFWGLNAAPEGAGGVSVAKTIGWILGVVGVACFGLAAYGLLRRLGGEEEFEE